MSKSNFKRTFAASAFIKNKYLSPFVQPSEWILKSIWQSAMKLINNKTFEHDSLIFTESEALANEIMLNIKQNFKFDFLENNFWANWGVSFKFHF